MLKKQIILIIGGAALIFGLFFFGKTVDHTKQATVKPLNVSKTIDFELLITKAKESLSPKDIDFINNLSTQAHSNVLLSEAWEARKNYLIAAYYLQAANNKNPNGEGWIKTAKLYALAFFNEPKSPYIDQISALTIDAFNKAIEQNPEITDLKIALANFYIESKADIMSGVKLLLSIVEKQPDNVTAQMTLARLAITSGQYDKAIKRLETIIGLQPNNPEAYFTIAEAYLATGEKGRAIESIEKCKTLVNDDSSLHQLDDYITKIKNS